MFFFPYKPNKKEKKNLNILHTKYFSATAKRCRAEHTKMHQINKKNYNPMLKIKKGKTACKLAIQNCRKKGWFR